MSNIIWIINAILSAVVLVIFGNWAYTRFQGRRIGGALTNEEFEATMRKGQIIDVREKADFKKEHILGARNIPYSMFKATYGEVRPDLPVYVYADNVGLAIRAAKMFKKNNYQKVYYLQNGFNKWEGKTKTSKY